LDHLDDEELARLAQDGDPAALDRLLARHQAPVFALAQRILGRREDALDATQETCLRLVRHLGSYDPSRPFRPWLRQVTVRAALDFAKRRPAGVGVDLEELAAVAADSDPQQVARSRELAAALQRALAALSAAQRAAFVLKEIEGLDTGEVARAMGCLKPTVRWHLFEARRRLAEQLAGFRGGGT
jgi:RNA polymerase sigma-70 factor (ECF subfamily)